MFKPKFSPPNFKQSKNERVFKRIFTLCDIQFYLTFHSARQTFRDNGYFNGSTD